MRCRGAAQAAHSLATPAPLLRQIFTIAVEHNLDLWAEHRAGVDNVLADFLSRPALHTAAGTEQPSRASGLRLTPACPLLCTLCLWYIAVSSCDPRAATVAPPPGAVHLRPGTLRSYRQQTKALLRLCAQHQIDTQTPFSERTCASCCMPTPSTQSHHRAPVPVGHPALCSPAVERRLRHHQDPSAARDDGRASTPILGYSCRHLQSAHHPSRPLRFPLGARQAVL